MAPSTQPSKDDRVVVVGAGVFGLSTALELSKRGYRNITVLDRYPPPAIDGSSVDISRIVRNDYADPIYARMAKEAMSLWESDYPEWFHRCGSILLSSKDSKYVSKSLENLKQTSQTYQEFNGTHELRKLFRGFQGDIPGVSGYANPVGSWVDAAGSIGAMAKECALRGVSFVTGPKGTVLSLDTSSDGQIRGVVTADGLAIPTDRLVVATGAWTNQLVDMKKSVVAAGQPVGFIQLTADEARQLYNAPVMIDFDNGCFTFPPTPDTHVLKIARHGWGYGRPVEVSLGGRDKEIVSSPVLERRGRTTSFLPADADEGLRDGLKKLWPKFADRAWINTRLCWYCDTANGDFIFDNHPDFQGVFVATGGSGHAFKFLPVVGKYIADCFEGIADAELREKWAFRSGTSPDFVGDGSRGGPRRRMLSPAEVAKL
ncbi:L-pipecolate oxidase [Lasiodiplodia theobromae]|uniref:L-pipecolate oxidase n=1 Tax=Lasiodiplodia theobromae TaxID=45133 RepID=A0A5N5DGE8_9PEZI|nr:L-pipecolate oxidase [Lasiodiplodia theobromae]